MKDEIMLQEMAALRQYKNGRLRELLAHSDDIEHLHIRLDWCQPVSGIDLSNVVGDRIWPKLRTFIFSHIEMTEEDLIQFLDGHKNTLRELRLDTICLTSRTWTAMIPKIQSSLQLDKLYLKGRLMGESPWQEFDMGMIEWYDERLPEDLPKIKTRRAVSD